MIPQRAPKSQIPGANPGRFYLDSTWAAQDASRAFNYRMTDLAQQQQMEDMQAEWTRFLPRHQTFFAEEQSRGDAGLAARGIYNSGMRDFASGDRQRRQDDALLDANKNFGVLAQNRLLQTRQATRLYDRNQRTGLEMSARERYAANNPAAPLYPAGGAQAGQTQVQPPRYTNPHQRPRVPAGTRRPTLPGATR